MLKVKAFELLGVESLSELAAVIGVSPSAVSQWPDVLPLRIEDRVLAALARKHLPPELIGVTGAAPTRQADESAPTLGAVGSSATTRPGAIPSADINVWPLITDRRGIGPQGEAQPPKGDRRESVEAGHVR